MDNPILITGAARSGTSLVSASINLCGAFGGDMSGPTRYNKKGMFENSVIRDRIIKPYLRLMSVDPKGQYPLPDNDNLLERPLWKETIENVFISQGYKEGPWMYKGAKMCLFWKLWHNAFPNAKWVIVKRNKRDIVNSCLKTGFMNAFHDRKGWEWWVDQHLKRFKEMESAGLDITYITPEKMVEGDYTELYTLIKKLGLTWNSKVLEFIDTKLWHTRRKIDG